VPKTAKDNFKQFLLVHPRRQSWRALLFLAVLGCSTQGYAQNPSETDRLITVWAGALPIILAAPHGGRQGVPRVAERLGVGIKQFVTGRDTNTDELANSVGTKLAAQLGARPFVVIAHFDRKFIDVNRSPETAYEAAAAKPYYEAYHNALREACERLRREWGRGLLLDLHGQGTQVEAIFRGTHNGKSVSNLNQRFGPGATTGMKSILGQMELKGYKIFPGNQSDAKEQQYLGGYTIQSYGSHQRMGVDAMQLELGTGLRSTANLERTAADLAEAIKVFAGEYLPISMPSTGLQSPSQP
jgi:N-formylglutamate amidohydrolase